VTALSIAPTIRGVKKKLVLVLAPIAALAAYLSLWPVGVDPGLIGSRPPDEGAPGTGS